MSGRVRLLLATVCGVAVGTVYAAQPVLDAMGADLGVPLDAVGWLVATGQVGYLVGLVALVPLGDLLDRRRLITAHLVLVALAAGLVAAAPTGAVAFAGLAAVGLFAVVVQTTVAYTAAVSPAERRGRDLGVVTAGVVVGILGARAAAGVLAGLWGWRSVYVVLGLLAAVLAVLVLRTLPADRRDDPPRYLTVVRSLGSLATEPVFWRRALIAFFLFASFGTLWSGLSLPLARAPWHLGEAQIGLFGLAGLAGALGAARAGRWADSGHAGRTSLVALALLVLSWAAIGRLESSLVLLVVGVVVLDLAVQAVHVTNQHVLTEAFSERTSTVIGGYMVLYSLGSALGAASTTAAFGAAGWVGSSLLGAGFALAALLTWAVGARSGVTDPRRGSTTDRASGAGPERSAVEPPPPTCSA